MNAIAGEIASIIFDDVPKLTDMTPGFYWRNIIGSSEV